LRQKTFELRPKKHRHGKKALAERPELFFQFISAGGWPRAVQARVQNPSVRGSDGAGGCMAKGAIEVDFKSG